MLSFVKFGLLFLLAFQGTLHVLADGESEGLLEEFAEDLQENIEGELHDGDAADDDGSEGDNDSGNDEIEDAHPDQGGPNCEDYEHECPNGRCIPQRWICDSDDDCWDGTDEEGCPDCSSIWDTWDCYDSDKLEALRDKFIEAYRSADSQEDMHDFYTTLDLHETCEAMTELAECQLNVLANVPDECEEYPRYSYRIQSTRNSSLFSQYICDADQLNTLITHQECILGFHTSFDIEHQCFIKEQHSSQCSQKDMATCAYEVTDEYCGEDAADFVQTVVEKLSELGYPGTECWNSRRAQHRDRKELYEKKSKDWLKVLF